MHTQRPLESCIRLLSICPRIAAPFHSTRPLCGLEEFFENGEALPIPSLASPTVFGRAWSCNELRLKGFEDLHKLWFVLLKETNLLATQKSEAARLGQRWFGNSRVHKCRLSMARIKTVLTERAMLHKKAVELMRIKEGVVPIPTEGHMMVAAQKEVKMRQLWRQRTFRKKMNYIKGRRSRFV